MRSDFDRPLPCLFSFFLLRRIFLNDPYQSLHIPGSRSRFNRSKVDPATRTSFVHRYATLHCFFFSIDSDDLMMMKMMYIIALFLSSHSRLSILAGILFKIIYCIKKGTHLRGKRELFEKNAVACRRIKPIVHSSCRRDAIYCEHEII